MENEQHDSHVNCAHKDWWGNADLEKTPCFSCNIDHFYHAQPWTCAGCYVLDHGAHVGEYLQYNQSCNEYLDYDPTIDD